MRSERHRGVGKGRRGGKSKQVPGDEVDKVTPMMSKEVERMVKATRSIKGRGRGRGKMRTKTGILVLPHPGRDCEERVTL